MEHAFFINASFGISAALILGLLLWIILSARKAKRALDAFEQENG